MTRFTLTKSISRKRRPPPHRPRQ